MSILLRGLMLFMTVVSLLSAVEGGGFAVPGDEPAAGGRASKDDPTKPHAEKPASAAKAATVTKVSHHQSTEAIAAYATAKGLKLTVYGAGPVRIWLVGAGAVNDADAMVATGEQVLQGLEIWTGMQGLFTSANEDEHLHVILFARDADYGEWLDQMRKQGVMDNPEGDDLAKKLGGTPIPRGQVKVLDRVAPLMRHYVAYAVCTAAIDAFYLEHGGDSRKHSWLREGLAAEMQRLLCDGQVRCYTITYEDASVNLQEDWAKTMATLMTKRDQTIRPTREIMSFELIKMPAANYIQMWSLCTYLRSLGKNKKGPDNLFAKLLTATASGTASDNAVKAAFGSEDPKLSRSWLEWASTYRTDPKGLNR